MFDDAWRTMKYRFYDPKMHGKDWDAMRAKYRPLVEYVGDRQELLNIINEMIGELNASHTGAAPPPGGGASRARSRPATSASSSKPTSRPGRYKVTHVYEDGPADKDWVKVEVGDYLIAIDGKPVKAGDDYWELLEPPAQPQGRGDVQQQADGRRGAGRRASSRSRWAAYTQLRYERWVKERREMVDKLSGGRVGYLHIQAMDQPSLRKFEKELREYRDKEALVIDQRWNGGGNIEQELLAILVQRQYQVWQPRGTEADDAALRRLLRPEGRAAELALGLERRDVPGRLPRAGPGQGGRHADDGRGHRHRQLLADRRLDGAHARRRRLPRRQAATNMENYGVQPDILVENTPEDNLAGRDRQLETAVQELLKELAGRPPPPRQRRKQVRRAVGSRQMAVGS